MAIFPPVHVLPFLALVAVIMLGLWLLHCIVHAAVAPATPARRGSKLGA